jgi:hypothetical protein
MQTCLAEQEKHRRRDGRAKDTGMRVLQLIVFAPHPISMSFLSKLRRQELP